MILKQIHTNDESYLNLVKKQGSVFNLPQWLNLYKNKIILLGIFNNNNELIGALFYTVAKKFGLKYALLPSYTPNNGFLIINPAVNDANRISFEKEVHEAICNYYKQQNFALLISALPVNVTDTQVYFWNKFKVIPNYTYQLDLTLSEENLFNCFTSERRKSIKKAEKDNLQIINCTDYTIVFDLICKTFERKEKEINKNFVKQILFEFANNENSFAFVAYQNNLPIATTFIIYYANTCYYLLGGYNDKLKHHGAGPACMWQSITYAKSLGIKLFDFEGSMLPEVEKYFREFGGALKPYYTIQKAILPIEMVLKLKFRNKF